MNTFTAQQALAHHGIGNADMTDDQITDAARAHGVISVCLGCGSITAMAAGWNDAQCKLYAQTFDFGCCADSDDILYWG